MEPEIEYFINQINAKSVRSFLRTQLSNEIGTNKIDPRIFKRENYFVLKNSGFGKFLIIKISRSEKPFWGVDKRILEVLNEVLENYYLILLESNNAGYIYSKKQIMWNINQGLWNLAKDNNYKINYGSLSDDNHFLSSNSFLSKIG